MLTKLIKQVFTANSSKFTQEVSIKHSLYKFNQCNSTLKSCYKNKYTKMFIIQHEFYENTVTTLTLTSPYSATLVLLLAMFSFWGEPVACESPFNFVWLIMNDRKWCKEKVSPEFPLKAFSTKFVQTKCCCNWNAFLDGEANWVEVEGCRWKTFEKLGNKLKLRIFYVHTYIDPRLCMCACACASVCVCCASKLHCEMAGAAPKCQTICKRKKN